MFSALDENEKSIVVGAITERKAVAQEKVIVEGDEGDCLYIVGSGTLSCTKIFKGNTEPTFLKKYTAGEAFGELALLYNAPRAATITAEEECVLWKLDRGTFNHIVKGSAIKKREKYDTFLQSVTLLSAMDSYERSKLADAFTEHRFKVNEFIIREGEPGKDLFILQEGQAAAVKVNKETGEQTELLAYKSGDYFGERALIMNEPRACHVVAKSDLTVVSMDRHSVKRLLGPLEHILKRNMEVYAKYAPSIKQ